MATQAEEAKGHFFKDNKGWAEEYSEMQRGLQMDENDPMWWFIFQQVAPKGDGTAENVQLHEFKLAVDKLAEIKNGLKGDVGEEVSKALREITAIKKDLEAQIKSQIDTEKDGERAVNTLTQKYDKMDKEAELLQKSIDAAVKIYGQEPPDNHLSRYLVENISNRRLLFFLGAIPVGIIALGFIEWLVITYA
jgi:hypothetical protein